MQFTRPPTGSADLFLVVRQPQKICSVFGHPAGREETTGFEKPDAVLQNFVFGPKSISQSVKYRLNTSIQT